MPIAATSWGLACGIAAAVLLLVVSLYGLRRRSMRLASRLRLGSARRWLHFHLIAGVAFLVLLGFHTGLRSPDGGLAGWLWLLSGLTVASGVLGLTLQRWLPRVMGSALHTEVHYDRIPELALDLRTRGDALLAVASQPIQTLYQRRIAPVLERPRRSWIYFADVTGGVNRRLSEFEFLRSRLDAEEAEHLLELEHLYRTKLELDAHYTLQWALRAWLWLHVPPVAALWVAVGIHIFSVSYY